MRHLTVAEYGSFLGITGNRLVVRDAEGGAWEMPLSRLRTIRIAKKGVAFSSDLILSCAARGIRIFFLDWRGISVATISGQHQHAVVRVRKSQFECLQSDTGRIIATEFIRTKIKNQRAVLLYFSKYLSKTNNNHHAFLTGIAEILKDDIDALSAPPPSNFAWKEYVMGIEGHAAATYWQALIHTNLLPSSFFKREGRGSQEITNICLNYGYAILQSYCWSALDNAGLELYAGFLHADRPGKPALILDFMEEYRPWVVDRIIIKIRQKAEKSKFFDNSLKNSISTAIADCLSKHMLHHGKRIRLENIMQRQAYKLAGAIIGEKKYRGYRFKW